MTHPLKAAAAAAFATTRRRGRSLLGSTGLGVASGDHWLPPGLVVWTCPQRLDELAEDARKRREANRAARRQNQEAEAGAAGESP